MTMPKRFSTCALCLLVLLFISVSYTGAVNDTAPTADAGPDLTSAAGTTVTLRGSGSTDADGDALRFSWSVRSAPSGSAAALSDPTAVNPTLAIDEQGTYVLQLVVNDGMSDSAPDTVVVSTTNSAPVARAGAARTVSVGTAVTLDGSGATDVDGDNLSYRWSLVSTPADSSATLDNATAVRPTFIVDVPGTYVAELVVRDVTAASKPASVTFTTSNSAPIANAGSDRSVRRDDLVLLDGTSSSDPDGDPLTYGWALIARPAGSVAALVGASSSGPSFVADRPGTYVVQLVVADGRTTSIPRTIAITTANSVPTADAGADVIDARVGTPVALGGGLSNDPDGDLLTSSWSLIARPDGSSARLEGTNTIAPTFTPDVSGDYVAQLIVSDGATASVPDTVLIRAHASPVAAAPTPAGNGTIETIPIASLIGTWSGGTGQTPSLQYKMWVDTGGVIGIQTAVFGTGVGVCGTLQIILNMVPPATITAGDTFTANFSGSGGQFSGTVAGTFLDATSASGTIDVSFIASTGCSAIHTTWSATHVDPGPIPVISVTATDPGASEAGPDNGSFTISRTGSTAEDVFVQYGVSGTASSGVDYQNLSFSAKIPAGDSSVVLNVVPINDAVVEGSETVILTLSDFPPYVLGSPTSATVTIADQPTPIITVEATDPDAYEAGLDPGTFTFTRVGDTSLQLNVLYTLGGTATHGTDYESIFSPVTFAAGSATATRTVVPRVDGAEPPETVILTLTDSANYDLGVPSSATVTISDTAPAATVTVSATDGDASEVGPDAGTFTFTRTGSTAASLTVNFTTTGSATVASDYSDVGWTSVVIGAGQASATKTVTPIPDALTEGAETVIATLGSGSYTIGTPSSATVTIADAPVAATVTVSAADASASEVGPDPGRFTFSRTGSTAAALTVNFAVSGTAAVGSDYTDTGWTSVVIPAGQASVDKAVTPVQDASTEPSETVIVTLSPGGYAIGSPSSATVTIQDASALVGTWSGGTAQVPSLLHKMWVDPNGVIGIESGVWGTGGACTSFGFGVNIVPGAAITNGSFSVSFTLSSGIGVVVAGTFADATSASGTIDVTYPPATGCAPVHTTWTATHVDPGPVPRLTVAATDASASETGPDTGKFTISRTGSTAEAVPVSYGISGTASSSDYGALTGSVTIPAGQVSVDVIVTPVDDGLVEGSETVILTINDRAPYLVGTPSSATVTIADAPAPPTVTVMATDGSASEVGPDAGTFTFSRTGSTAAALTVNFTTTGTAAAGTDYSDTGWTSIVIPAGQASVTKDVTPLGDALVEPTENVVVTLAGGAYTIGTPSSATVTIADAPTGQPNLQITKVAGAAVAGAGLPYSAKDTTLNAGVATAPASATKFFLSANAAWDGGDTLLVPVSGRSVPSLGSGVSNAGTTAVTIPAGTVAGKWFLIAYADAAGLVGETNETDNTKSKTIYIGPDLVVSTLAAPASAAAGTSISVNDTTANSGGAPTTVTTTTRFYLSLDKKLKAGDIALGPGRSVGPLAQGAASPGTTIVTIPAGTATGLYYLLAMTDDAKQQAESKETNNVKAIAITVN